MRPEHIVEAIHASAGLFSTQAEGNCVQQRQCNRESPSSACNMRLRRAPGAANCCCKRLQGL